MVLFEASYFILVFHKEIVEGMISLLSLFMRILNILVTENVFDAKSDIHEYLLCLYKNQKSIKCVFTVMGFCILISNSIHYITFLC